jgi:hypothetical protein
MLLINDLKITYDFSVWGNFPIYQALLLTFFWFLIKFYYNYNKKKKKKEEKNHIPELPPIKARLSRQKYAEFKPLQRELYFRKKLHNYLSYEYQDILATVKFRKIKPKNWIKYPRLTIRPHGFITFMKILFKRRTVSILQENSEDADY